MEKFSQMSTTSIIILVKVKKLFRQCMIFCIFDELKVMVFFGNYYQYLLYVNINLKYKQRQ